MTAEKILLWVADIEIACGVNSNNYLPKPNYHHSHYDNVSYGPAPWMQESNMTAILDSYNEYKMTASLL